MTIDLNTEAGRKRANKEAVWGDHGFLRLRYHNHRYIGADMWRANQPNPDRVAELAALGFKTILNLRGPSDKGYYLLEKEACEKHGIKLVDFRMYSRDTPRLDKLHGIKKVFDEIEYPAVMHCKSGSDRTGISGVLFKHFKMGVPISEAMEQLSLRYGHIKAGKTGMLDFFFNDYLEYTKTNDIEFMDWVDTVYDPADVKARFMSGWIGNILTEKVFRRE